MGDHIICAGIYRNLSLENDLIIIPTTLTNLGNLKQLLSGVSNSRIQLYKSSYDNLIMDAHAVLLNKLKFGVLRLGYSGRDFFVNPKMRLDENFYMQAGVNLSERWDSFKIERDYERESQLFDLLVPKDGPYIFLHEDPTRNFIIDRTKLPINIPIVKPDPSLSKQFTVFDYLKIIENSTEIHCIESSFCALIESMQYDIPKFAHRYARPEAKSDYRQEFTYRSKWEILL
jgi:hypothetical protein